MADKGFARPGTQEAMDLLVEGLAERQREARREFAVRFGAFSAKAKRKRFERLFGGSPNRDGGQP